MIEIKGKKYIEADKNAYVVSMMTSGDLYDVLCEQLSFNTMIRLYKLIKHKMEVLDDEPRNELTCCKYEE